MQPKLCVIKTISGSVNLRKQNAKAHFFHAPRKGGKGGREVFLDKATSNAATGGQDGVIHRSGTASFADAIPGTNPEIGGRMITQSFQIAEGEIIKAFINVRLSYGRLPRSASVFLRVREEAAYRRLRFNLIDHADTVFTHAEVEGNFDLITVEEAVAAGCHIPKAYLSFSDPSNIETVVDEDIIIREEKAARVIITEREVSDGDGTTRVVRTRKRRRKIG